ncbi:MAG: hypothetical protein A3K11_04630 [Nitrospirae bacterium RIFCSPLOWO2_12_FULL_63_8]|nr:MAG: hypothetical protein A3K11_04630 [Nitrospirae bacterium RIFCSPLOWO2_12_FULL_63_8]
MQTLDVENSGLPDLQFVLMVLALCTSDLPSLNVPEDVRQTIFHRCWALMHDTPPPAKAGDRVLDLRDGTDLTLEAMVEVIRGALSSHGITQLRWDHPSSEPTRATTPEALPLVDRLQKLYPADPDSSPEHP